ncbi:hypothetical protein F5146DRAFT_1005364 [Armillaria mellea]|nr:hypothetical protein F5146DRAFT_1005364 [Armillaria mellea]
MSLLKVLPIQCIAKRYLMFPCRIEEHPLLLGCLMDDSYDAWNNTSLQYDWPHGLSKEQWGNTNWGLLHHALTWTEEHHDADGKIALIAAEQGCKLWVSIFPTRALHHHEVSVRYKWSLASFLLLVLDPVSYIPMHCRAYRFPVGKGEAAERTACKLHQKALSHLQRNITHCTWASLAQNYTRRVAAFISLPRVEDLKTFLAMGAALSDPGEKISLSGVLNEILQEQKKKWEGEEE